VQKNWRQQAKIRLVVHKQHIEDWSKEKEERLYQFILREFSVGEGNPKVKIEVYSRGEISIEFTALSYDASVDAMRVVKALEDEFFGLKIYRREISFKERKKK